MEFDIVEDMERRRRAEGYSLRGDGRRAFGSESIGNMLSVQTDCRFCDAPEEVRRISTICGFPTHLKDTNLAVTSCDLRLDALDDGVLCASSCSVGEDSNSTNESES